MALLDIFDEVARNQTLKTPLGENRIYGAITGIVVENYDTKMPGKIGVSIPIRDEVENKLVWASVVTDYGGSKWGQYFIPEKNDQVLIIFEDGNIEKPFVIGCVHRNNDTHVTKSIDENNNIKQIVTRNGTRITFADDTEEEGAKDKLTLSTAGDAHQVILDNEAKKITVMDKEKNCVVEMATENGNISITAKNRIDIKVGDKISVAMNGESGAVTIDAEKFKVKTSAKASIHCDGSVAVSGKLLKLSAESAIQEESDGAVSISGKTIKMGQA